MERRKVKRHKILLMRGKTRVNKCIARPVCQAGVLCNTFHLESFSLMLKGVDKFGPWLRGPSCYELSAPLLKEVELTVDALKAYRDLWVSNWCTIMIDAWTERKGHNLMTLIVNCGP